MGGFTGRTLALACACVTTIFARLGYGLVEGFGGSGFWALCRVQVVVDGMNNKISRSSLA